MDGLLQVRAAALSGDCDLEQEIWRGQVELTRPSSWFGIHSKCVARRAALSVALNPNCRGEVSSDNNSVSAAAQGAAQVACSCECAHMEHIHMSRPLVTRWGDSPPVSHALGLALPLLLVLSNGGCEALGQRPHSHSG